MAPRVILCLPLIQPDRLAPLAERLLIEGVELLAICGPDAAGVEDQVDELVVGDGSDPERFLLTSSHPEGVPAALELLSEMHPEATYQVVEI